MTVTVDVNRPSQLAAASDEVLDNRIALKAIIAKRRITIFTFREECQLCAKKMKSEF